jgi:hypothetical protein
MVHNESSCWRPAERSSHTLESGCTNAQGKAEATVGATKVSARLCSFAFAGSIYTWLVLLIVCNAEATLTLNLMGRMRARTST